MEGDGKVRSYAARSAALESVSYATFAALLIAALFACSASGGLPVLFA